MPLKAADNKSAGSETSSTISSEIDINGVHEVNSEPMEEVHGRTVPEVTLLDIYSGCGAMSTGLCLGAHLSGLNLVTVSYFFLRLILLESPTNYCNFSKFYL